MSSTRDNVRASASFDHAEGRQADLQEWPDFELGYLLDDGQQEVTIYDARERGDPSTNWLTVAEGGAIPMEEWR